MKIEKGAKGGIPPHYAIDILSKKINRDIVIFIMIPFLFSKCRKCSKYLTWTQENASNTCPDCMISICFRPNCTFLGIESDFHLCMISHNPSFYYPGWLCRKHWNSESIQYDLHMSSCRCSYYLSVPKIVETTQKSLCFFRKKLQDSKSIKVRDIDNPFFYNFLSQDYDHFFKIDDRGQKRKRFF